jgi:periplasmic protein TonB
MEPKKNPSKDVHRYSKHFFLIGLCMSIALIITAFEWRSEKKIIIREPAKPEEPQFSLYPIPITYIEQKPLPKPTPEKRILTDLSKITEENILATSDPIQFPEDISIEPLHFNFNETIEAVVDTFIVVERMPVPLGGYQAFYKQLAKNMKYPSPAKRSGIEGKVIVEFVIAQSGRPINLKVIQGIGYGCNEEAIRVLSQITWQPGNQRGHAVPVKMTMPIYFKLNSN